MTDLFIIFSASLLTFFLYARDKHFAVYGKKRIPEFVLLLFSFLGGAFGALFAMILFRHKTRHLTFQICVPLFLILQLLIVVLIRIRIIEL